MDNKEFKSAILESNPVFSKTIANEFNNFITLKQYEKVKSGYKILSDFNLKQFLKLNNKITFKSGNEKIVPSNLTELNKQINNHYLVVSTENDKHDYFSREENFIFRAVHDYKHYQYKLDFNIDNEIALYFLIKSEFNSYLDYIGYNEIAKKYAFNALFTENIAQLTYLYEAQKYPKQKLIDYTNISDFNDFNIINK